MEKWTSHRARLAAIKRWTPDDTAAIEKAEQSLRAARDSAQVEKAAAEAVREVERAAEKAVRDLIAHAPVLTPKQRDTLATLFRPEISEKKAQKIARIARATQADSFGDGGSAA